MPEECWSQTEYHLRTQVRNQLNNSQEGISLVNKLRIAFWDEYERAAREQDYMHFKKVHGGICKAEVCIGLFKSMPVLLAWITSPLAGYLMNRKELNFLSEERMVEIMSVSAVRHDGRLDARAARVQVELYLALQDRIHGPVIEKSETKSVNVNVNSTQTPSEAAGTIAMITDMEELDRRLQAVRAKTQALKTVPQPIEVNTAKLMKPARVGD